MRQVFVHREEDIKISRVGNEAQKLAIFDARPARARNGLNFVAGQIAPQTRGQTFIKDDAHLRGDEHSFAGFFEKSDGLLAGHGGEIFQKISERIAALDVVN